MQCPSCGTTELPLCSKWCLACGEKLPPHLNAPQTEPERESVAETENNLEVDNRQIQGNFIWLIHGNFSLDFLLRNWQGSTINIRWRPGELCGYKLCNIWSVCIETLALEHIKLPKGKIRDDYPLFGSRNNLISSVFFYSDFGMFVIDLFELAVFDILSNYSQVLYYFDTKEQNCRFFSDFWFRK